MSTPVNEILHTRGKEYGDRFINLECIAELKAVYHKHASRNEARPKNLSPVRLAAFHHCMEMVLVKVARIATGAHKGDNYDDASGYLELARYIIEGEQDVRPTR